ncbi:hypothetical protein HOH87_05100 [bacterium]|nr:hypothetical protein [bacterium]
MTSIIQIYQPFTKCTRSTHSDTRNGYPNQTTQPTIQKLHSAKIRYASLSIQAFGSLCKINTWLKITPIIITTSTLELSTTNITPPNPKAATASPLKRDAA